MVKRPKRSEVRGRGHGSLTSHRVEARRLKRVFKEQVESTLHVLPPGTCKDVLDLFRDGINVGVIENKQIQRFGHYPSDLKRSLIVEAKRHRDPVFRLKQLINSTRVPKRRTKS